MRQKRVRTVESVYEIANSRSYNTAPADMRPFTTITSAGLQFLERACHNFPQNQRYPATWITLFFALKTMLQMGDDMIFFSTASSHLIN